MPGRWASPSTRRAGVAHSPGLRLCTSRQPETTRGPLCTSRRFQSGLKPGRSTRPLRCPCARVATCGTAPPRQRPQAPSRRDPVPSWPFTDARPLAVEVAETAAQTGALTASVFDAYRPSVRVPGACPHPTRLVESAAMAAATSPECHTARRSLSTSSPEGTSPTPSSKRFVGLAVPTRSTYQERAGSRARDRASSSVTRPVWEGLQSKSERSICPCRPGGSPTPSLRRPSAATIPGSSQPTSLPPSAARPPAGTHRPAPLALCPSVRWHP